MNKKGQVDIEERKSNAIVVIGFIGFVIILSTVLYFAFLKAPAPTVVIQNNGVGQTLLDTEAQGENQNLIEENFEISEEELAIQERFNEILTSGTIEDCKTFNSEDYIVACEETFILQEIQNSGDIALCDDLTYNEFAVTNCNYNVIFAKLQENLDLSVCDETNIDEVKSTCISAYYLESAVKNNDISFCDEAEDKDECINNYHINTGLLNDLSSFDCNMLKGEEELSECKELKTININSVDDLSNRCFEFQTLILNACYQFLDKLFQNES